MSATLSNLTKAVSKDPGLLANVTPTELSLGLAAADAMNAQLIAVIEDLGLNDDGLITEDDMEAISVALQSDPAAYEIFLEAHGDDEGGVETGFHNVQSDGGTLMFQGRKFVDTVADAIYHYGFEIVDGSFLNEDGNNNEEAADVAGWLNYFLNGVNVVYGSGDADELYSGDYSSQFADAANETFMADLGNDSIWADVGNDTVWTGKGNDKTGGGAGDDTLYGENGKDTLWGDDGNDMMSGGGGRDEIGAGMGNDSGSGGSGEDTLYGEDGFDTLEGDNGNDLIYSGANEDVVFGGEGNDTLGGDAGNDSVSGGEGNDSITGSDGKDTLVGDAGNDTLYGGEGSDTLRGGAGADQMLLWENAESRDTLVFKAGDAGTSSSTKDVVEGFDSGVDKIDLRAFEGMVFEDLDYRGGGTASCYFDGKMLRIDTDGNATTDMIVEFKYQDELVAGDFLFA